jgi:hypothetical protein
MARYVRLMTKKERAPLLSGGLQSPVHVHPGEETIRTFAGPGTSATRFLQIVVRGPTQRTRQCHRHDAGPSHCRLSFAKTIDMPPPPSSLCRGVGPPEMSPRPAGGPLMSASPAPRSYPLPLPLRSYSSGRGCRRVDCHCGRSMTFEADRSRRAASFSSSRRGSSRLSHRRVRLDRLEPAS